MARIAMSLSSAKSREGRVFRVEAIGKLAAGQGAEIEKRALFHLQEHAHPGAACGGRSGRRKPWIPTPAGDVDGNLALPPSFCL